MKWYTEERKKSLETYLERLAETHKARGMAVAVVSRSGKTEWQKFLGWRDAERHLPIDENTMFGLASVTKSFTALALMQMAERGTVDLFGAASRYCPDFKNSHQASVTLAHFLSHSGGYFPLPRSVLPPVIEKMGLARDGAEDLAYSDALAEEGIKMVAQALDAEAPRIGKPGEYMSYCNDGYGVLADVIRRHGGCASYAAYLNEHIIKPLGMERSTCEFQRPAQDENTAKLYCGDASHKDDYDFYHNAFVLMGGGAMKSTLADMKRYLLMLMNEGVFEGRRIVSAQGVRAMTMPRIPTRNQQFYGFGLSTSFIGDVSVIRHGGSLHGVSSHIAWSPELELGVLVLCNTSNVPVSLAADAALRCAMGLPAENTSFWRSVPWSAQTIEAACGTYRSGEGAHIVIHRDGDGITVENGGAAVEARMVHPFRALLKSGMSETELRLYYDEKNTVWGVRLGERIVPRA